MQKTTNYRILNIKMSTKGGPAFMFTLPGWRFAPVIYATAGSANLYDIVANLPEGPQLKKAQGPENQNSPLDKSSHFETKQVWSY